MPKTNKRNTTKNKTRRVGKQGLSGYTQQGFSEDEAQKTLKEIDKAIDFAATSTTGGAVVFHTGEWQRPIMNAGIKLKDKELSADDVPKNDPRRLFGEYEQEYNKGMIYLADKETGQIQAINRTMKFYFPVEKKNEKTGMMELEYNKDGTPKVEELDYEKTVKKIKDKDRKSTRLNSSHVSESRMPSSA